MQASQRHHRRVLTWAVGSRSYGTPSQGLRGGFWSWPPQHIRRDKADSACRRCGNRVIQDSQYFRNALAESRQHVFPALALRLTDLGDGRVADVQDRAAAITENHHAYPGLNIKG